VTRFIERTLTSLLSAAEYAAGAEELAEARGVLQSLDPRVKVVGLLCLIIAVAACRRLDVIAGLFAVGVGLAIVSRIALGKLAAWVWMPVLFFTGAIALPAIFLTPGAAVLGLPITETGLRTAAFLVSRAETSATLSVLLVLSTPWPHVLKALRILRFPVVFVAILGMTYRYIFVILQTAFDMFESRKSRTVGVLDPSERRRVAASAAGVLLSKSLQLSGDVHLAMQSRGFRGEVYVLDEFRATGRDRLWLATFIALAALALWMGR
jgi:cobalt/nickel transport system permease protein